ncbi:MAG TPA: hypothetical protein VFV34_28525 [Blastocatellia bacterium]|nr:hypothetical protein [Blastocatellia bacterium]
MTGLLDFLDAHRGGILILFLSVLFTAALVQWVSWIFGWGRFKGRQIGVGGLGGPGGPQSLRFVFSEAAVKLINDFRHLLALVIVLIFGLALGYAMILGRESIDTLKESLQAVVATLGGLVGSIIGYYFGESSATKTQPTEPADITPRGGPPPAIQGTTPAITPAPPPPPEGGGQQQETTPAKKPELEAGDQKQ